MTSPEGMKMQSPGHNVVHFHDVLPTWGCSYILTISMSMLEYPVPSALSSYVTMFNLNTVDVLKESMIVT